MRNKTMERGTDYEDTSSSLMTLKKKLGAAAFACATGLGALTGCSSEGSDDGGPAFTNGDVLGGGSSRSSSGEVLSGAECAERDDIYTVGTYARGWASTLQPYQSAEQMLSSVAIPDGVAGSPYRAHGVPLDIEALPQELKDDIWTSYNDGLSDPYLEKFDKQLGYVVLYGDKGKIDEYENYQGIEYARGGLLDGDLEVCTFNKAQGSVDSSQFLFNSGK